MSFAAYLRKIASPDERRDLAAEEAHYVFGAALDGGIPELELGALLAALRMKGESTTELLGFYQALAERIHHLIAPAPKLRIAVIGSYGSGCDSPNLTPLVALVLQRLGVPVLVHGTLEDKVVRQALTSSGELGVLPCATLAQAQAQLDRWQARVRSYRCSRAGSGRAARTSLPHRHRQLSRNALASLLDPFPGASLRLVALPDPADLDHVREFFLATGDPAIVLPGTGGEPFADPRRRPRIEYFRDGRVELLFGEESAAVESLAMPSDGREPRATAAYIKRVLDGTAPLPCRSSTKLRAVCTAWD